MAGNPRLEGRGRLRRERAVVDVGTDVGGENLATVVGDCHGHAGDGPHADDAVVKDVVGYLGIAVMAAS
jgi:hypothetical protein